MNCYQVEFRRPAVLATATYSVIAEDLESAIEPAREELAGDYGSEEAARSELQSVREIARGVLLPTTHD